MSFYLGKDSSGTSVMAVSKTAESAATLKDAVNFHNLAYHSKYQYTNVDIYTTTVNREVSGYYANWTTVSFFKVYAPPGIFKVNGIRRMFLMYIVGNPTPVTCRMRTDYTYQGSQVPDISVAFPCYNYTDDTFLVGIPQGVPQTLSLEFLLFDMDYMGNLLVPASSNSSIIMDPSGITVRGENYFTTKWLVSPAINNIDRIITLFGRTVQIVNSVPTTGAVELNVNSEKTTVKYGGKVVLDSTANYYPMIYNQNVRSFEISNQFRFYINVNTTFRTGLPVSDSIAVLMFHGLFNRYNPYTTLDYSIPVIYNPAYDTGLIPLNPLNGYPGYGGSSACFGTLFLRIQSGVASILFGHHFCTMGTVPESDRIYNGPYYVVSTHVVY